MEMCRTFQSVLGREVATPRTPNAFAVEDDIVAPGNSPDKNVAPDAESEFESDIDGIGPLRSVLSFTDAEFQGSRRRDAGVEAAERGATIVSPRTRGATYLSHGSANGRLLAGTCEP